MKAAPPKSTAALGASAKYSPNVYAVERSEIWVSRLVLVLAAMFIGFGLALWAMIGYTRSQSERINLLEHSRVMFGFPNEKGVFVSTEKRPEYMVKRFAREYVNNLYNYDPDTIAENFKTVSRMTDPETALRASQELNEIIKQVASTGTSQSFVRYREEPLIEDDTGYTYTTQGRVRANLGTTITKDVMVKVVVTLKKVTPTTARTEGLVVYSAVEKQ